MRDTDISILLRKADELKALFVLGQRVIPFLEEIFLFVRDIKPLLDDINVSIEENLKKMPNASKQLSKVTEATESSTIEIMDIVDGIVYKTDVLSNNMKNMDEINRATHINPMKILEMLYDAAKGEKVLKNELPQIKSMLDKLKESTSSEFENMYKANNDMLNSIRDDSSSIMMSLQVQDITSQQLAAVNHMLQAVQTKLGEILVKFQNTELGDLVDTSNHIQKHETTNISHMHRAIAFDPEAVDSITSKATRQNEVDDLINSKDQLLNDSDINDVVSSDDIDSYFNNASTAAEPVKTGTVATPPKVETKPAEDDFEAFSQDDIDALFGGQ